MSSKHRRNRRADLHSIWSLGFVLNLFFLYAVFQIYFQSPVVEIQNAFSSNFTPPKYSRVLFFVCDGLRADTFFRNPTNHPYLTSLLHINNSVWGISDTRVPTESRPGHIALFAGIYEDPSAIFTGWKKNFVEFDSVFNRSMYSIALGSPDIVDMFGEGAGKGKVHFESYPPSWQDFVKEDAGKLDNWVLDRFKRLASKGGGLPRNNELLIFLHLLGVDNIGHSHKPASKEYLKTLQGVDGIVKEVEKIVQDFYRDGDTLFIFTSDHGMTDWGSHGAGSIAETETPFIVWGAGIKSSSVQMRLKQADFTALIAGALGIKFPTNSIGRFPPHIWIDNQFSYHAVEVNFEQLQELLFGKKELADCGKIPLIPFSDEDKIQSLFDDAREFAKNENYGDAVLKLEEAIDIVLEGIIYYERYNERLMKCLMVYVFIIWILIITVKVVSPESPALQIVSWSNSVDISVSLFLTFVVLEWPPMLIPYTFVPIYLTRLLISLCKDHGPVSWNSSQRQFEVMRCVGVGLMTVAGTEIMVMTFYHREFISLGLLLDAVWYVYGQDGLNFMQKLLWMGLAFILAVFPTIPIIGLDKTPLFLTLASLACSILAILWIQIYRRTATIINRPETSVLLILYVQIFQVIVAGISVHFPEFILTRIFAWLSIPSMFLLPVALSSPILSLQFLSIFLAIFNPFVYLTLNVEVFFLPTLFATLFILVKMELTTTGTGRSEALESSWNQFMFRRIPDLKTGGSPDTNTSILKSLRVACFQLCFVYVSFFGIGNIASISSFDPTASRCFVSVFSPFTMMGLLLIKIVGPFLLVACAFRLLMTSWKQVEVNFTIVLCLCQIMALHMFLNVTNVGSWLEIGTSISHFVIVQVTTIFLFLLFFIANFLIGWR